jgi:hypothetical protein
MDNPVFCETHHIGMIREQVHIGDGRTSWSEPYCPACREIASRQEAEIAKAAAETDEPPAQRN